jgi:hypothetical protein
MVRAACFIRRQAGHEVHHLLLDHYPGRTRAGPDDATVATPPPAAAFNGPSSRSCSHPLDGRRRREGDCNRSVIGPAGTWT